VNLVTSAFFLLPPCHGQGDVVNSGLFFFCYRVPDLETTWRIYGPFPFLFLTFSPFPSFFSRGRVVNLAVSFFLFDSHGMSVQSRCDCAFPLSLLHVLPLSPPLFFFLYAEAQRVKTIFPFPPFRYDVFFLNPSILSFLPFPPFFFCVLRTPGLSSEGFSPVSHLSANNKTRGLLPPSLAPTFSPSLFFFLPARSFFQIRRCGPFFIPPFLRTDCRAFPPPFF